MENITILVPPIFKESTFAPVEVIDSLNKGYRSFGAWHGWLNPNDDTSRLEERLIDNRRVKMHDTEQKLISGSTTIIHLIC